jgi:sarcosine oxidase, subunit alpha
MTGMPSPYNPRSVPRLPDPRFAPDCTIEVDGRPLAARAGESVAAALLAAGRVLVARSAKYHRPRGPFCLAGSCHACLARVDGLPNQRTCRVACRPGLVVESQNALPTAGRDLLGVIDRLYPHGLDHHHLMTWSQLANRAAVAFSRALAGTGTLAGHAPSPAPTAAEERFDAVVVGGGPAGLGAAEALAGGGARVLLVEGERALGGRLRCGLRATGDPPASWAAEVARALSARGGEARTALTAIGLWRDGASPVLALAPAFDTGEPAAPALRLVRARAFLLATGSFAAPPVFPRNDLPGIFAGRAVARLLAEDGILPGSRCVVAGEPGTDGEPALVAAALRAAGAEVVLEPAPVQAALGRRRLAAVALASGERLACDALVWCGARVPASELPRQAGAPVELDDSGGWRVRADAAGRTGVDGLRAAGEVVSSMSAREAAEAGRRAGEAALADG